MRRLRPVASATVDTYRCAIAGGCDRAFPLPGGRFIGVECKAKGSRQSPAQKQMQQQITRRGGICVLARSVEDLERGLTNENNAIM